MENEKNTELAERMKNVAWLLGVIRERAGKKSESAGTQLTLQDAEQALAKTREERDALKAENAELREQIRDLEHERHCALLQSKANSQDAAHWKQTAEAMTKMFMDVEGELRELKAKATKAACEEA